MDFKSFLNGIFVLSVFSIVSAHSGHSGGSVAESSGIGSGFIYFLIVLGLLVLGFFILKRFFKN